MEYLTSSHAFPILSFHQFSYFSPIFHTCKEWMLECSVSIPGFLEEDTVDTIFDEIICILHRIFDHEGDTVRFAGMRFRSRLIRKMIHKVHFILSNVFEIGSDPAIGSFFFPDFLIGAGCDDRDFFAETPKVIYSCSRSCDDRDTKRIHSRLTIERPEILSIFFRQGRIDEGYIIAVDILDSRYVEELALIVSYVEKSWHCRGKCLIEIKSDMDMSFEKRSCHVIGVWKYGVRSHRYSS